MPVGAHQLGAVPQCAHRLGQRGRQGHDARRGESIGGIAYLYLRGMDASVPGQGIWEWKPSVALIRALECCLAPTNDEVDR